MFQRTVLTFCVIFASATNAEENELYVETMTSRAGKHLAQMLDGRDLICSPDEDQVHVENPAFFPITVRAVAINARQVEVSVATNDPNQSFSGSGNSIDVDGTTDFTIIKAG